jgi:hypothetical protein
MDPHEDEDIAKLAYRLWEERGRPLGSPEVDWYQTERELESRQDVTLRLAGIAFEPGWAE